LLKDSANDAPSTNTGKGERLVIVSRDYVVKLHDSVIVIDSKKAITLSLYPLSSSTTNKEVAGVKTVVSKKYVIKSLNPDPNIIHKIKCHTSNSFDKMNTLQVQTLQGLNSIRLQSCDNTWLIM
jgi:hypothetical protein